MTQQGKSRRDVLKASAAAVTAASLGAAQVPSATAGESKATFPRTARPIGRVAETTGRSGDLPTPAYARNMRLIGHTDQGGRLDGIQIMVYRGYAYIGHAFSKASALSMSGIPPIPSRLPTSPRHPVPGTFISRLTTTCCW
jgi:hypothetical protein